MHQSFVVFNESEDVMLFEVGPRICGDVVMLEHINHLSFFLIANVHDFQQVTLPISNIHLHAHILHI